VRRVILILTDGLRPDAITPQSTPCLDALSREYCAAPEAVTVRPSTTLAALASLVTGVAPSTHRCTNPGLGIVGQLESMRTLTRELRLHGVPMRVESGEIAPIQRAMVAALAAAAGIAQFTASGATAGEVAWNARREAAAHRSGVTFVYLNDCDVAGHRDGWMSPAYLAAASEVDAAVGTLAPLAWDSLLIVLADHGGGGVSPHDHHEPHAINDRIPLILAGPGVARRRRVPGPVSLLDVPPTLLYWLGIPVPAEYEGRVLVDAFDPRARATVIAA
jgi:hypothetical protein